MTLDQLMGFEVAPDFAYGHTFGLRQIRGEPVPMTAEETASRNALQAELDRLADEYQDADELPDEVDERLSELEAANDLPIRLRIDEVRVFYDVSGTTVEVLAIVPKSEAESWLAQFGNPE